MASVLGPMSGQSRRQQQPHPPVTWCNWSHDTITWSRCPHVAVTWAREAPPLPRGWWKPCPLHHLHVPAWVSHGSYLVDPNTRLQQAILEKPIQSSTSTPDTLQKWEGTGRDRLCLTERSKQLAISWWHPLKHPGATQSLPVAEPMDCTLLPTCHVLAPFLHVTCTTVRDHLSSPANYTWVNTCSNNPCTSHYFA